MYTRPANIHHLAPDAHSVLVAQEPSLYPGIPDIIAFNYEINLCPFSIKSS